MSSKMFVAKGTGGQEANNQRNEQATMTLQDMVGNAYGRAKDYQGQYDTYLSNTLSPLASGWAQYLSGDSASPFGASSSWATPVTPTLSSYAPSSELQSQVNPTLDVTGTGKSVYDAWLASSDQNLADQYSGMLSDTTATNARRGLTNTSFAPGALAQLAIQRGQGAARNKAQALSNQLSTEQGLRNEQRSGATTLADLLRTSATDQNTVNQQNYSNSLQNYLQNLSNQMTAYNALQGYGNTLSGLGDTSQIIGQQSGVGSQYGNLANSYGQMAQQNASLWSPVTSLATSWLTGGLGNVAGALTGSGTTGNGGGLTNTTWGYKLPTNQQPLSYFSSP
jgi:hypothetical protein